MFCDILRREEKAKKRLVDGQGHYLAFCPYSSRVPYEVWIMPRKHNPQFDVLAPGENRRDLATLLGRVLRRVMKVCGDYHMVLHTSPNTTLRTGALREYWKTIASDYHWHIEIMPIVDVRSKSYSIKEVYFNTLLPELAARRLREMDDSR